ncbi:cytochrome P450 [Deinococcus peraridilitoris]|uniref:Cytochrome P450 n=1 Tax=Deinococcus peraridilitoris (strain DSM 19664 / LMG 22246 / CIP 109416 / KR-200) TaxID=937777 RepID=L0A2J1_DEIPD|nr:cytochrome P450 [Deinococcus peraridilitoris]AFZ68066.1 cytochrome P450 [Deinococcus peraridilitoris DSM 19664]
MVNPAGLPAPEAHPYAGHFPRWGTAPLQLLQEGAQFGTTFQLKLGLPTVVGFGPTWNRSLLTDLESFVSAGSFSRLVPYLSGGVIMTDAPGHRSRRAQLREPYGKNALLNLQERVRSALYDVRPSGEFDALSWADRATLSMLNAAYFSGEFDAELLHAFLAPLRLPFPSPMWPRPILFARVNAELRRLAGKRLEQGGDDLLSHLARLSGGLTEARVTLAAGHDTTTHTLAWTLWHLAQHGSWRTAEGLRPAIRETLRLYPSGWIGSRRVKRAAEIEGVALAPGNLVIYSPFLSGRSPEFWTAPEEFRPQRFEQAPLPWTYLPFGGGERVCLGMHLAHLLLEEALGLFLSGELSAVTGDPTPRPGVTLGPTGPLVLRFRP